MSVHISSACKKIDYTGAKRDVLLEFADHANDDGICWPSRARIMYNTGLSESAVKQAIKELKAAEVIVVVDHGKGGRGNCPVVEVHPEKGPQKPPFKEWWEKNLKGSKGSSDDRERGQSVTPEPSVKNRKGKLRNSLRSSRAESEDSGTGEEEGKVVPLTQYHMGRIYDHLKEHGIRLDGEEFAHNMGRVKNVLANDSPTDQELEDLPQASLEYFRWFGNLDAAKALRRYRQQGLRQEGEKAQRDKKAKENGPGEQNPSYRKDRKPMTEEMQRIQAEIMGVDEQ